MKLKTILSAILALVSVGLAVLAYIILPETVVTQFSIDSSENTTVPKLLAILIPTALGVGGAVGFMFSKDNEKASGKNLLVSVVGIVLFIIMIAVNTFIK